MLVCPAICPAKYSAGRFFVVQPVEHGEHERVLNPGDKVVHHSHVLFLGLDLGRVGERRNIFCGVFVHDVEALGDIRLVLADRLQITDEERADEIGTITDASQVTNNEEYMAMVYNFISWVQDSLMLAMIEGLDEEE